MRRLLCWIALHMPAPASWRPRLLGAALGRRPQRVSAQPPDSDALAGSQRAVDEAICRAVAAPPWTPTAQQIADEYRVALAGALEQRINEQLVHPIARAECQGIADSDLPVFRWKITSRVGLFLLLALASPLAAQTQPDPFHLTPASSGGGGGGTGTVTSVGATVPSWLSVAGSPITTSGTLAITTTTQLANLIFAGPASGAAAAPTFRALDPDDIPATIDSDTTGNAATATVASDVAANSVNLGADTVGGYAASVTEGGAASSVAANSVALGGDTTGGYAASSTEGGAASSVAANSVALGTDTTGGYAGSATEAGAATSALAVSGLTASRCLRSDGSGNLVVASADCASGDTTASPAGSGSELQFRSSGSAFGAVTSSSVSGANVTLGGTLGGITQLDVDSVRIDDSTLFLGGVTDSFPKLSPSGAGVQVQKAGGTTYTYIDAETFTAAAGGSAKIRVGSGLSLGAAVPLGWSASANPNYAGTSNPTDLDVGIGRVAPKVAKVTDGSSGFGWQLQWAGQCYVASDQTNATVTPASSTCSITVTTGRKYAGLCIFHLADSVAADGAAIDFDGGTATATNFRTHCTGYDSALAKSQSVAALATDVSATTFTGDGKFECNVSFEPSSTGTFIPRFFQAAHTTGTLTLYRGSYCALFDMP